MKTRIKQALLWCWPMIQLLYARFGLRVRLEQGSGTRDAVVAPAVSGGQRHSAVSGRGVPGAH